MIGTITIDIAKNYLGPEGEITGVEPSKELLEDCRKQIPKEISERVKFVEASAQKLPFPDESFDIVHCHQVLLHLPDPLQAMKEMRRVVKKDGIVCSRDADLDTTVAYPEKFHKMIHFSFNGKIGSTTKFKFGRTLRELSLKAGFENNQIKTSTSNWSFSSNEEREWFGDMFVNRFANSTDTFDEDKEKDKEKKEKIVEAWKGWKDDPNGWFLMTQFEVICTK